MVAGTAKRVVLTPNSNVHVGDSQMFGFPLSPNTVSRTVSLSLTTAKFTKRWVAGLTSIKVQSRTDHPGPQT